VISCIPAPGRPVLNVTFTVADPEPGDHEIHVVGDFNGWDRCATPMRRSGDSHVATVALDPGSRYRFRYLSSRDGWFNDQDAGWYEYNEFGQRNCVLDLAVLDLAALRRLAKASPVPR
jgi:hypothetical protein